MIIIILLLMVPVTLFLLWIKALKWAFKEMDKRGEKITLKSYLNYKAVTRK